MMRSLIAASLILSLSSMSWAQGRRATQAQGSDSSLGISYDISASVGNQGGESYTEINLGINWALTESFTWRNSVFSRQGSAIESVQGLDSSMRYNYSARSQSGATGLDAFIGPGVRLASRDHNAGFAEAGVIFTLGGLRIGGGAKVLSYFSDRDAGLGPLPKNETQYFLILAGGGSI